MLTKTLRSCLVFVLLAVVPATQAAWIPASASSASQPVLMGISSSEPGTWAIELSIPGVSVETKYADGQVLQSLSLLDERSVGPVGQAELPCVSRLIGMQTEGDPVLEVVSEEWSDVDGIYSLALNMGGEGAADLAYEYSRQDKYYPENAYTVSSRQVLGGVPLCAVQLSAVKYNPAQGKLRVLKRATVRVRETGPRVVQTRPITENTASILRAVLPNWNELGLDDIVVRGTLLYIVPKDSVKTWISELVTWRRRMGRTVEVAGPDVIGNPLTTSNVTTYIQGRYNSADPPLEYVCLVGDADGSYVVPAYDWPTDVGDWQYTRLDGSDLLPDVAIGRMPYGSDTELAVIVQKTVRYERTPAAPNVESNPTWYQSGGVVGDVDTQGGDTAVSHLQTVRWVRERMLDAGYLSDYIDTLYWTTYHGTVPATAMNTSINSGVSLWCYRGWYTMNDYDPGDALALTNNDGAWPLILTYSCGTNQFDGYDICEAFMIGRGSYTSTSPRGAIGAIGMSSPATHTPYNNILMTGAVQGLLREGIHSVGGALTRSKLEMYRNYPFDSSDVASMCQITTLLGDPAVDIFTDTPETLQVNVPSPISVGTNYLALVVTNYAGTPVEGAYVNLLKGSETSPEVFVGDWTAASGEVMLNFNATTAGEVIHVTVTKHNCIPAVRTISVTTGTQYVSPASGTFVVDDDNNGGSSGNSDGLANPGETIELAVALKNWGTASVSGVNAVLSESDPYVSISDNSEHYGSIAAGATDSPDDDFDFTVASYAADGHIVQFTLVVTDTFSQSWSSRIPIRLSNARLEHSTTTISGGNGNAVLDPAETVQMYLSLVNSGTRNSPAGRTGYLRSTSHAVAISDSVGTFTAAAIGAFCNNSSDRYTLTGTEFAYPGERVPMTCVFPLSSGFADTVQFEITIGSIASNAPTPPDDYGYWAFDNTDTAYSNHPTYSFVEIDSRFGGSGTVVNIVDDGENEDASAVVSLPFPFRFYGEEFDSITICSNGWLAMGADQVVHSDFRNYTIPSATGASRMIAPFWDDLLVAPASLLTTPAPETPLSPEAEQQVAAETRERERALQIAEIEARLDGASDVEAPALKEQLATLLGMPPDDGSDDDRGPRNPLDQGSETCSGATVVGSLPYHASGTLGATDDCPGRPYFDVFYVFTVPVTGSYTFDMCDSYGDTYLKLWRSGTCCSGQVSTNDEGCGGQDPTLTIVLTSGQVVYIECGMYYDYETPGAYNLNVVAVGDVCDGAQVIASVPATVNGSTLTADADYAPGCGLSGAAPDTMFSYTPSVAETLSFTLCTGNTNYDARMAILRDGVEVACSDDDCNNPPLFANDWIPRIDNLVVNAGHEYCIVVTGYSSTSRGNFTLNIEKYVPPIPAGVYTYHDAANHQFIVEWSRVNKFDGGVGDQQTFECILHEPGYPATPTGDGEIEFQYLTCSNTADDWAYGATDYATVGIENATQTDGVLYSYWNMVSPSIPGAATMTSGRAILFTTQKSPIDTPLAPTKLTLVARNDSLFLRWSRVAEDIHGNPLPSVEYRIYHGTTPATGTLLATVSDTTYIVTPLPDARHFYNVQASTGGTLSAMTDPIGTAVLTDESRPASVKPMPKR